MLMLSLCLSMQACVTLRYYSHIGWVTLKVITRVISLESLLFGATAVAI